MHITVCQLFVLRRFTGSYNCLLRIIIIIYLKAYNCVPIICIKNSYLKLELFTKDYYYYLLESI